MKNEGKKQEIEKSTKEKCDKCREKAVAFLPYGPHNFCKRHFLEFFEARVRKTIRKYGLIKKGEKIVVGVSGGKDSLTTLFLLKKYYSKTNKIQALMLDEGIKGYRDKAIKVAVSECRKWKVPYTIVPFRKKFGITMTEIMKEISKNKSLGSSCSFCGPMRRSLLNRISKELKADKIATGHNLDDEAQSIAMNFFENDLRRMSRLGAIAGVQQFGKLVPRIKPLYECPEKEVIAFAQLNGIQYYGEECCPFSFQAKRNYFRKMLNEMEEKLPGTKYSILRAFEQLKPLISKKQLKEKPNECKECGELCVKEYCKACEKLKRLKKEKIT